MKHLLIPLAAMAIMSSCEKALIGGSQGNVSVSVLAMEPISRATVGEVATRLQVAVYDDGGTRQKQVCQTSDESGFGSMDMTLSDGSYTIMALAHSGEGNATTTNLEKMTFDGKVTDTFVKAQALEVSGNTSVAVSIDRCVARVKVIPTDSVPEGTSRVKFYYTGGSSTLNGSKGVGAVQSRQTEYRSPCQYYDLYTFPRADNNTVTLTITALSANDDVLSERKIEGITVKTGYQTTVTGSAFNGSTSGGTGSGNVTITIGDTEWKTLDY